VPPARRAYTLFELLLVLVLLVLLAAIAYPTLDGVLATFRMTEAADMVRANWADARAYAMNEGRAYRFSVISAKATFVSPRTARSFGVAGTHPWQTQTIRHSLSKTAFRAGFASVRRTRIIGQHRSKRGFLVTSRLGGPRFVSSIVTFLAGWNDQGGMWKSCSPAPGRDRWM